MRKYCRRYYILLNICHIYIYNKLAHTHTVPSSFIDSFIHLVLFFSASFSPSPSPPCLPAFFSLLDSSYLGYCSERAIFSFLPLPYPTDTISDTSIYWKLPLRCRYARAHTTLSRASAYVRRVRFILCERPRDKTR